jgi:hypothetical protein
MWLTSHHERGVVALFLSIATAFSSSGQVQTAADDYWRRQPQPVLSASADAVSRTIRAARNKAFDHIYGPPPKGWVTSGPDVAPIFQEIPASKGETVALVHFADYTTILSASRKSVYTEVRMDVEQVLQDPSGTVRPGKALTVVLGGGSLRLPSGKIVRRDLDQGSETGLQPGHRYLAFLFYSKNGGDYFECVKSWDLSGRTAGY